mgnify:CR=1 FL=1
MSGYKSPNFDERQAFSASSWLATLPVDTLAQVGGPGTWFVEAVCWAATDDVPHSGCGVHHVRAAKIRQQKLGVIVRTDRQSGVLVCYLTPYLCSSSRP